MTFLVQKGAGRRYLLSNAGRRRGLCGEAGGFMGVPGIHGWRRWAAAAAVAAGLGLTGMVSPLHALAADSSITGVVENTSGTPQASVAVNVLDPVTGATDGNTTTASDGTFTVAVDPRTYNVQFIPPLCSGLQTYLAPGVSTCSAPLTIILTATPVPTQIQLQGTLADSVFGLPAQASLLTFSSPLNPGVTASRPSAGSSSYSATLVPRPGRHRQRRPE